MLICLITTSCAVQANDNRQGSSRLILVNRPSANSIRTANFVKWSEKHASSVHARRFLARRPSLIERHDQWRPDQLQQASGIGRGSGEILPTLELTNDLSIAIDRLTGAVPADLCASARREASGSTGAPSFPPQPSRRRGWWALALASCLHRAARDSNSKLTGHRYSPCLRVGSLPAELTTGAVPGTIALKANVPMGIVTLTEPGDAGPTPIRTVPHFPLISLNPRRAEKPARCIATRAGQAHHEAIRMQSDRHFSK